MNNATNDKEHMNKTFSGGFNIASKDRPLKYYQWGNHCEGWNLVDESDFSVKLESMPPGTEETLHYHQQAQQFFFILKGSAFFEIDGKLTGLNEGQGMHIRPKIKHRIINRSDEELQFILCSQPSTQKDRFNFA